MSSTRPPSTPHTYYVCIYRRYLLKKCNSYSVAFIGGRPLDHSIDSRISLFQSHDSRISLLKYPILTHTEGQF